MAASTTYNILPLERHSSHDVPDLPWEVCAAIEELDNYDRYDEYKTDIFEALGIRFGFQLDNIRNQREHLVLLLANSLSQQPDKDPSLAGGENIPDDTYNGVYGKIMQNYVDWCSYMKRACSYDERKEQKNVDFAALYLCIWGEAANIRFLPECICYIFHHMAEEFKNKKPDLHGSEMKKPGTFLKTVITPIYKALKAETKKNNSGKSSHSKWRNYDDFNEYFWTSSCFKVIGWPIKKESLFFSNEENKNGQMQNEKQKRSLEHKSFGKTSFVEHRTFFHLYHSFVRVWILLVMMFQGLTIMAYVSDFGVKTLKFLLSLGPTYFFMKFIESVLDITLMMGAYKRSPFNASMRIFAHFFFYGGCTSGLLYLYLKMMLEGDSGSNFFKINLLVLGLYMFLSLIISLLLNISSFRSWSAKSDQFRFVESLKWLYQDRYFVGRRMFEKFKDYIRYVFFWVILLSCKFTFSYFLQIKPLMDATPAITSYNGDITYAWHDFISKNNYNALTVFFLWAPVTIIYLLDIILWYAVFSAILGGILGARDHLGEIRTLDMIRHRFDTFPSAFVKCLQHKFLQHDRTTKFAKHSGEDLEAAGKFAPFWNKIISLLREEDYISNREEELLHMPNMEAGSTKYFWRPLFLLVGKISVAVDLSLSRQWEKVVRDPIMISAVKEVLHIGYELVSNMVQDDNKLLPNADDFEMKINNLGDSENLNTNYFAEIVDKLKHLIEGVNDISGKTDLKQAVSDVCGRINGFVKEEKGGFPQNVLAPKKNESFKRLQSLLTVEFVSTIPRNVEAQRRLQFFTNSLFMKMPVTPTVRAMKSFSILTPYYKENVLFSKDALQMENEDGITILFYLQKVFPDEWANFLERIKVLENSVEMALQSESDDQIIMNVRLWASYRGQTLARTVRGMMYYKLALILQSQHEIRGIHTEGGNQGSETSALLKFYADLKFTYVVSCQIYGQQKSAKTSEAKDIHWLMKENEDLRVAFVEVVNEDRKKEGKNDRKQRYFSKLVKVARKRNHQGDLQKHENEEQTIYSIELPGDPILGEGKPENQNHAVIFTRGDALQTIDMNQDNYFEEALKMRNLLEEFSMAHGTYPRTILGVREHVFTGSVSSLAWFMSNQEASFVTLGQRVLARPLKVRMHYGHPDVFDRIFHLTRGGFSKASKAINVSEDIYAGFNTTLRRGNVTHHEYIQVGKGRDVGLNQIALFEAKVSSGNGEQSLSRDVYRLGQLLDFFRMLSFYVTSVGYYFCTMMMVLAIYLFLYGKAYLALSGIEEELETLAHESKNKALQASLDTQFLFQIGSLTTIPMLSVFILEQGILKACISFITMQLQLCSVFFTFSLGTRAHYFGKTILHGGAKYRETGRGFVVKHITFAENYRLYSRSHFVKALEIVMLLLAYLVYGYNKSSISYTILSISSWFVAVSWLFAPSIFNPSGFEWQKTVGDFDNWTKWLTYRGGAGVKQDDSWEAWWEEQEDIRFLWGRILETVLSLRFLVLQYGVVYHLKGVKNNTSLAVYGVSWLILFGVILTIEIFSYIPENITYNRWLRLFRVLTFITIISGLVGLVILTDVTVGDIFASLLALIPTGWGILCIGIAWKPVVKKLHLWKYLRSIARFYDAAMGMVIFFPVAILSWFPFMSTLQTRLLFNQAFSRGLEISLILAGSKPNYQA